MDTVGDLMTREVLTIDPADSLGEAAEKMIDRSVGALVVSDFGNIIGILTERDILRAAAHRTSSAETRVRQWMQRVTGVVLLGFGARLALERV